MVSILYQDGKYTKTLDGFLLYTSDTSDDSNASIVICLSNTDEINCVKEDEKPPEPEQAEPACKSSRTPKEGDSEALYEVEKKIDCRTVQGKKEYLLRSKGYSRQYDTWIEETDLSCPDLLHKFKSEKPGSLKNLKKRPSKSLVKATTAKKTKKDEK